MSCKFQAQSFVNKTTTTRNVFAQYISFIFLVCHTISLSPLLTFLTNNWSQRRHLKVSSTDSKCKIRDGKLIEICYFCTRPNFSVPIKVLLVCRNFCFSSLRALQPNFAVISTSFVKLFNQWVSIKKGSAIRNKKNFLPCPAQWCSFHSRTILTISNKWLNWKFSEKKKNRKRCKRNTTAV